MDNRRTAEDFNDCTSQIIGCAMAQALNYLEAYNMKTGLLLNFGSRSLTFKRLNNKKHKQN
ncbi:MAG: GxxExxY protein [Flavipsychrobacter sp.]|jgi:GxxExxY protein|nr:GxxExxY protein [Flavipsychrobacter sp.]